MNLTKCALAVAALSILSMPAQAQSQASRTYAVRMANVCPGNWESTACMTAGSESNLVMASNYGATLKQQNLEGPAETLKQHCAASTAHREGRTYPAYAMQSAFTECANIITDLVDQTGVKPDVDHYQLIVLSVLCMSKDKRCAPMERGLMQYKGR